MANITPQVVLVILVLSSLFLFGCTSGPTGQALAISNTKLYVDGNAVKDVLVLNDLKDVNANPIYGDALVFDGNLWRAGIVSSSDQYVKISAGDTTASYLQNKLTAGSNKIIITKLNAGGNEQLSIDANIQSSTDTNCSVSGSCIYVVYANDDVNRLTHYVRSADASFNIQTVVGNTGKFLRADGSWQTVTISTGDVTSGTGISLGGSPSGAAVGSGFSITNTAPDQIVVLTPSTGINVTGTYPNFTVTNTSPDQVVALTNGTGITISGSYPNFTITNSSPAGPNSDTNAVHIGDNITQLNNNAGYITNSSLTPYLLKTDGNSLYAFKSDVNSWGDARYYPISLNPAGYLTSASLSGYLTQVDGNIWYYKRTDFNYLTFLTASDLTAYLKQVDANAWFYKKTDFNYLTFLTAESDPIWNAVKGNYTLQTDGNAWYYKKTDFNYLTFLTAETDPVFIAWDYNYLKLKYKPANCPTGQAYSSLDGTCIAVGGTDTNWQTSFPIFDANMKATYPIKTDVNTWGDARYYQKNQDINMTTNQLKWLNDGDQQYMGNTDASKFHIGSYATNSGTLAGLINTAHNSSGDFSHYYLIHNVTTPSNGTYTTTDDNTSASYIISLSDTGYLDTFQAPATNNSGAPSFNSTPKVSINLNTGSIKTTGDLNTSTNVNATTVHSTNSIVDGNLTMGCYRIYTSGGSLISIYIC